MSLPDNSRIPDETSVGDEINVQELHAPIIREHNEPHDGFEPVPFWMGVLFAGLLAWGGWYIGTYTADFNPNALDRPDPKAPVVKPEEIPKDEPALIRLGEKKFNSICLTCHQASGEGNGKEFPPLNKSEWVVGNKSSPARLARILLYGLGGEIEVRGKVYGTSGSVMPAQGSLKDHEIAAVLTYVRNSWDNKAPAIWPQDITAARKKLSAHGSMSAKELEEVQDFSDPGAKSKPSEGGMIPKP
jgi:mono/diheme cytochrome c family protein